MRSIPLRVFVLIVFLLVAGVPVIAQDRVPRDRGANSRRRSASTARRPSLPTASGWPGWRYRRRGRAVVGAFGASSSPTWRRMGESRGGSRRGTARPGASNTRSPGRRMAGGSRSSPIATRQGQFQVYVAPAEGGEAKRLTSVTGFLADPRWSPDGARLGVLFTRTPPGDRPVAARRGPNRSDRREGPRATAEHHRPPSGEVREVSPPDLYVYEYDWSPDGTRCVAIAAHGSGDNHWYIAQLYVLAMATGEMTSILDPKMQVAVPRWSPDGRTIAFIGGLMSDEGATGGDIYPVPAAGGKARNLTPDLEGSASWLAWHPPRGRSSSPSTSTAAAAWPGWTWTAA